MNKQVTTSTKTGDMNITDVGNNNSQMADIDATGSGKGDHMNPNQNKEGNGMEAESIMAKSQGEKAKQTKKDNKKKAPLTLAQKEKKKMLREELKKFDPQRLIGIADEATRLHITSPDDDFKNHFKCEYVYRDVTDTLRDMGYKKVWTKVKDDDVSDKLPESKDRSDVQEYNMRRPDKSETVRKPITVGKEVYDAWKDIVADFKYPSICVDVAFARFIDDLKSGRIIFIIGG